MLASGGADQVITCVEVKDKGCQPITKIASEELDAAALTTAMGGLPPRMVIYKALAVGFSYPGDLIPELVRQGYFVAVAQQAEAAGYRLAAAGLQDTGPAGELQVAYSYYFDIGPKYPPCPPYAGIYQNRNGRPMLLWELVQFYRHFGLAVSPAVKELPDHVSVELEFMYYLVFKEHQAAVCAGEDGPGYRRAQRDFLARHLARWVPGFTARVADKCSHPFYRALAGWLQEWVAGEEKLLLGEA
ncbi:MAG: hypothetical protein D9V47_08140 [Clostridia bacterium]|nr:MAG: hypothetical protein D9V47_08140 [Clostridia bacterium]